MASEIRVDKITSLSGVGTITPSPTGIDIAGITTVATLKATTGIVTTLTATTGIVTTFEATTGDITTLRAPTGIVTTLTSNTTTLNSTTTATGNINVSGANITLGDSGGASDDRIKLGASGDLQFYHVAATANYIQASGGHANIHISNLHQLKNQANDEMMLTATNGGAVELYHDNNKRLATYNEGIAVFGIEGGNASIKLNADEGDDNNDQYRLIAGDGTSLYIQNYASGSWESNIVATGNGSVDLYYDNSKKFETTSSGATITGDLAFPSGNGISFAATSDAGGMTSELLDDYEEGTFTPRLGPNVSMSTIHENGIGRYTKVGNMVTCTMHWIAKDGTAFPTNETIRIDSLPYTIRHTGDNTSAHYIAMSQMMYNIQFGQQDKHYFYSSHNTTYVTGLKSRDGTTWQDWSTSDWNQSNIYFNTSITYMT